MSKVAIVLMNADFSKKGIGKVALNLGNKFSVSYTSGKNYTVSPASVYEESSATIIISPNQRYTFIAADAVSSPSAPSVRMNGQTISCVLEGENYVARISSVTGDIVVSGGLAAVKAATYSIALNLTNIKASLTQGGSAITKVDVRAGASKNVYLSTEGNYILPSSFEGKGVNCTINFTRTNDKNGVIAISATNNGSITASGVYVELPTWDWQTEIGEDRTYNGIYQTTEPYVDTGISLFENGADDFTILCKYHNNNIDNITSYLNQSYVFLEFESSGVSRGIYLESNNLDKSGTIQEAHLSICHGAILSYTPELTDYIVYCAYRKSDNKFYYKIKNLTNDALTVEGEATPQYITSPTNHTLNVGGGMYRSYKVGCKATIKDFKVYKGKFIAADNAQIKAYLGE